jgi:hypothetical protein
MFGEKKTKSKEAKWMMTFADLITLLFCFFVYLSLFNKPQVDLKTGFLVSDKTIMDLGEHLPNNIVSSLNSMKDLFFENKELFTEKLETVLGPKPTSLYKTEILIESIAKGTIDENSGVMKVQVRINEEGTHGFRSVHNRRYFE